MAVKHKKNAAPKSKKVKTSPKSKVPKSKQLSSSSPAPNSKKKAKKSKVSSAAVAVVATIPEVLPDPGLLIEPATETVAADTPHSPSRAASLAPNTSKQLMIAGAIGLAFALIILILNLTLNSPKAVAPSPTPSTTNNSGGLQVRNDSGGSIDNSQGVKLQQGSTTGDSLQPAQKMTADDFQKLQEGSQTIQPAR